MRSQDHTFFYLVAGDSAGENYLSRLFQACFAKSLSFRQIVLSTIWKSCSLPMPVPAANNWKCDYQPTTEIARGGRPDLCLRPPKDAKFRKLIFLESKLKSLLDERQLRKYRDHGADILVAVTKNRPEVPQYGFRQLGVKALRWQDFCRAMRQTAIKGPREQFICQSFAEYLEESEMAYREDLTTQHLEEIGVMLRKIALHKYSETTLGLTTFNYAHNCMQLLRDVRATVLERLPKLAQWTTWGPGYYHDFEEGDEETWHALGFSFTPNRWRKGERVFSCRLFFYPNGSTKWAVSAGKYDVSIDKENLHTVDSISSRIKFSRGAIVKALDAEKMAKTVIDAARKWHTV